MRSRLLQSLLLALLLGGLFGSYTYATCPDTAVPVFFAGVRSRVALEGGAEVVLRAESPEAAERAAAVLRERLGDVAVEGAELRVRLAGVEVATAERLVRRAIADQGVAFRRVMRETPFSQHAYALAAEEPGEVRGELDTWYTRDGDSRNDSYLRAPTRGALDAFVRKHGLSLEENQLLGFERAEVRDGERNQVFVRTYVLAPPLLHTRDIEGAEIQLDDVTGVPLLMLTFNEEGKRRFAEFTTDHIGEKVAIAVGDEVLSAPIVQGAITGGTVQVTMGNDLGVPLRAQMVEAEALRDSLRTPPLGERLEVVTADPIVPEVSASGVRRGRALFGAAAGGALALLVLVFGLLRGPNARPVASPPWRRVLVTAGGALLWWASARVPLPLPFDAGVVFGDDAPGAFHLGLQPLLSGFVLVELFALAVPRWRPLRLSAAGRARLMLPVAGVSVAIALLQGWTIANVFAASEQFGGFGVGPRVIIALTLAAGTLLYLLLARLLSRHGLLDGVATLVGAALLLELGRGLLLSAHDMDSSPLLRACGVLMLAFVVAGTAWFLRRRVGAGARQSFGLPTCGTLPLAESSAALALLGLALSIYGEMPGWAAVPMQIVQPAHGGSRALDFAVLLGMGLLYSWLFARPQARDGRAARRGFWMATGASIGFVAVCWMVSQGLHLAVPGLVLSVFSVVTLTAIGLDLGGEWVAWRQLGALQVVHVAERAQEAPAVLDALRAAGIGAYGRGYHFRMTLQFFGPYTPITVLVAARDAERAREVIASHLGPAGEFE